MQFVEAVGLACDQFHLVGLSLGGALAGLYSAKYPSHVERVTLICPASKCVNLVGQLKIKCFLCSDAKRCRHQTHGYVLCFCLRFDTNAMHQDMVTVFGVIMG